MISSPAKAWEEIRMENTQGVLVGFVYPMITLAGLSSLIGSLFETGIGEPSSYQFAMTKCCSVAISLFGGFYLAAYLLDSCCIHLFRRQTNISLIQQFCGYSLVVTFLLQIVMGLLPNLGIISLLLQFYIIYIVWEGSSVLLNTPEQLKLRFTILASVLLLICPFLIKTIFNQLTLMLN